MGCVANKPLPEVNKDTSACTSIPSYAFPFPEKNLVRSKLTESIKKRDIILFKKAIQQFQIQPSEFIGLSEQAKTLLHKLAESNFSDGMALILEEMSAQNSAQLSQVLNMKDADGNTPLLLCCLSNAVETLEVLSRCQNVDLEAKNCANKTALEIAIEMESPCVNILTSISSNSIGTTKNTMKSDCKANSQPIQSEEEDPRGLGFDDAASGNFDTRTSLDGKSASQALENIKSKDIARYVQLLADLRTNNAEFIDIEFPHEMWFLENEECEGELLAQYPDFKWVKPSKFMEGRYKNAKIFENFECNSVSKTALAGCEVYSALAAMAEYPSKLLQVFNTKEINASGLYSVNFTVSGVPIEILLDDYFPSTDGTQMLYSRPLGNEIWFSLLEKAFAKLHGGYYGLETIGILEAMETLTGMPVVQKSLNDAEEDKLWSKLIDYDKKNYILCVGENKRYNTGSRNRNYTIVNVMEVDNFKLIKLRNHFDSYTWTGDFSSRSPLWTKELKEKVGYCETDNTCFYMQLKDFVREFDYLTVCYYHENWINSRLHTACEPNHPVYFELNIEKETEVYISVHQKSQKFVDEEINYSISPVEIIVAKDLDGTNLEGIAFGEREAFLGKPTVHFHENYRVKLQPGRYLAYVKVKWIDSKKHDIVLNVHSSLPVKLNQLEVTACPDFLEKVYLSTGSMCKDKFNLGQDCVFSSGWLGSHLWMYAYNYGKKTWHLEISFEKMMNIQLGKKGRVESNVIKLVIPPQQKAVAYAKRTDSGIVSLGWEFKQRWE